MILTFALLMACAEPAAPDTGAGARGPVGCTDCALADANGFRYRAALSAAVQPGAADAGGPVVTWEALAHDLHGHRRGVDFEVDQALLLVFLELTPDEILERLSQDRLEQADVSLTASCVPTDDRCPLADFRVLGRDIDVESYYAEGMGTWLVLLRSYDEPGAVSLVFLPPSDGGAREIVLDDDTAQLDVDVDLLSLEPVVVAAGPDLTMRWSGLTQDGLGGPLALHGIDALVVARYTSPLADLEDGVFDLERRAASLWSMPVAGLTAAPLSALQGAEPFEGVDDDGTYVLWLGCTACANPAPKFVTWLTPGAR